MQRIDEVQLTVAPDKTPFSASEIEIYEYILLKKVKWKGPDKKNSISWRNFASYWIRTAKVQKLNQPNAMVYIRTAERLEEKWKTNMKKRMTEKWISSFSR